MNALYQELLENTTDWFWEIDINGSYIYSNKKVIDIIGYELEEVLNKTPFDFMKECDREKLIPLFHEKIDQKSGVTNLEYIVIHKNGMQVFIEMNAIAILNEEGNFNGFRGINRDITSRKISELEKEKEFNTLVVNNKELYTELQNQKNFLNNILQNISIPVFYKNRDGQYIGCNKAWENMTGIELQDVIGKSVYDIAPKEVADIYFAQDEKVFNLDENPQVYESEVYNKKENIKFKVVFSKSAYFDNKGKVIGLVGTIIDRSEITKLESEKKERERALYQHAKMSAMGEMLENIAHQWRQPLSIISTASSGLLLQKDFDKLDKDQLDTSLNHILSTAQSLSKTLDVFRDFFKTDEEKSTVTIKFIVEKTKELIKSKFNEFETYYIENIENIEIVTFKHELIHILLNIFSNSINQLKNLNQDINIISINTKVDTQRLIITIIDNAGGIDDNTIDRVFEPYFSAKNKSSGVGIGLFMNKKIIEDHMSGSLSIENSNLEFDSKNYKGAKVIISLPLK